MNEKTFHRLPMQLVVFACVLCYGVQFNHILQRTDIHISAGMRIFSCYDCVYFIINYMQYRSLDTSA